ncbi:hypothetical protein D3C73_1256040 [compost metagenome]
MALDEALGIAPLHGYAPLLRPPVPVAAVLLTGIAQPHLETGGLTEPRHLLAHLADAEQQQAPALGIAQA